MIDETQFRQAMGRFASGVTVVTTAHTGRLYGITVSSFSSLSLRPPLALICIDRGAASHGPIAAAGRFAVSVLAEDQAGLSQRAFARRAGVSFSTIMGLVHPELHPGRRGGMQRRTAWLIAQAYATIAGIESEAAFQLLIVERREEPAADHMLAEGLNHGSS